MLPILLICVMSMGSLARGQILVDKLRMDFLKLEEEMWKFVVWESALLDFGATENYLVRRFLDFDKQLKEMPQEILHGLDPIKTIHSFIHLYPELRQTENLYEKFKEYLNSVDKRREKNVEVHLIDSDDILGDILNNKMGANRTVHNVYNLTFGSENMLMKTIQLIDGDFYCKNYFQSPQQVHYNLYNAIALNGLKSYVMLQFAYLMKQSEDLQGNFTDVSQIVRNNFERRVNETMDVFRGAMEIMPRLIWRCDPKIHEKGVTYDEFTRLLQGHVQNEVDMNYDGTCKQNCAAYSSSRSYGCYDSESAYCRRIERCNGKIVECRYIESDMHICPSLISSRRYDYIEFKSGMTYGNHIHCTKRLASSWHRWFVHCSYCICLCDDANKYSDRYINLRPVFSDHKNNRVITGLRLKKKNQILHLQIQEGELLPYGYVNQSTVRWIPVDDYKITDLGVFQYRDFYKMEYDARNMYLGNLIVSRGQVLTGITFGQTESGVNLKIYSRNVNWATGKLEGEPSTQIGSTFSRRIQLGNDPKMPTLSYNSKPITGEVYVQFTHTGFKADAAQTTIPFFDIQPVYNDPAVPLVGAGLQYKTVPGYGGFVMPTISTYDYSNLLLARFPKFNLDKSGDLYEVEIN